MANKRNEKIELGRMSQQMNDIEGLFQHVSKKHSMQPSEKVLKNLRFKLWKQDFFSLQLKKFTIAYAAAIVAAIAGIITIPLKPTEQPPQVTNTESSVTILPQETSVSDNSEKEISESVSENTAIEEAKKPNLEVSALFIPSAQEGCAPLEIQFKNKSKKAESYNWDFGDGNASSEKNPLYTYENPGRYNAILTVTSEGGVSSEYEQNIWVLDKPDASFTIDIENSKIAEREIIFENNTNEAVDFQWNFGDAGSSTEINPVHSYSEFAPYEVMLIAKNDVGCIDTVQITTKFIAENYELAFPVNFKPSSISKENNGYYEAAESGSAIFYPQNFGALTYKLTIWAPNGMEVFSTTDIKQGWNGYIRGRLAPAGFYSYQAIGTYPNGQKFEFKNKIKVFANSSLDNYSY